MYNIHTVRHAHIETFVHRPSNIKGKLLLNSNYSNLYVVYDKIIIISIVLLEGRSMT